MILVYRYGLLRPTENAAAAREQIRRAHAYRNTLTWIERGRRQAVRTAEETYGNVPALMKTFVEADKAVSAIVEAMRKERSKTRTRAVSADLKTELKTKRDVRKEALRALREARARLRDDPAFVQLTDDINERALILHKSARSQCGVFWGTYIMVEDAMTAAKKAPLYDGADPHNPRFSRFSGEGSLGVQLQGGMSSEHVFGSDTRIRIAKVDPEAWHSPVRGVRRRLSRTVLYLRIGSDAARAPIWAAWPMVMHRPLPEGSAIKRVAVRCRRFANREEWSAEFTVELASARPTVGKGTVAIDIGWRVLPEGIRIASYVGDDGERGELVLGHDVISSLQYASKLRSIRDKNFNEARGALLASLETLSELTPWMANIQATLPLWRNVRRLADVSVAWRENRFLGDEEAFEALEKWRYNEHHLWSWEANQRIGSLRRRQDIYRVFAKKLADRYERVVWEDFDLRDMAVKADVAAESSENQTARSNRQAVGVSYFRRTVANAFTARGGSSETVPAADTTMTCNVCGTLNKFDKAALVAHTCDGCGATWDQDENAGHNLLARWKKHEAERRESAKPAAETRWERAERLRREKEARRSAANGNPVP